MTNRFCNPDDQYCDETGLPYDGGFLYFYASGTSTPLDTYSALTPSPITNTNPIELDTAGRPGSVFLQTLPYKVVLEDADHNIIWTMDPVYTSDYSTVAQFSVYPGNPNSHVAGTAGSGSVPSSVVWDNVNDVLYVCTTSGTATTAVWTAVNPTNAANSAVPSPCGYITPVSGTPIITSDQIGVSTILYTPFRGNICPVYNGTSFVLFTFIEQSLSLSSLSGDSLYDVFAFSNSGTFTVGTGPAWTTQTPGASARGTGAGTTQLQLINGINVNAVSMTMKNGATSYSVSANQATYLGTIYTDHTAGQVTCHRNWGQNRKFGIWNAYNRVPIYLKVGDSTASWTPAATRAANNVPAAYTSTVANVGGTTSNGMTVLSGLAEEIYYFAIVQRGQATASTTGTPHEATVGIGLNSISSFVGKQGDIFIQGNTGTAALNRSDLVGGYQMPPSLGLNQVMAMENLVQGANISLYGTESFMLFSVLWRG